MGIFQSKRKSYNHMVELRKARQNGPLHCVVKYNHRNISKKNTRIKRSRPYYNITKRRKRCKT